MRKFFEKQAAKLGLVGTAAAAYVNQAMAAVPAEVTTALSDAKSDGIAVGVAVLVAIVAIYALKLARKAL